MGFRVKKFFAENSLRASVQGEWIAQKYPEVNWIDDHKTVRGSTVTLEKQAVVFARKKGAWLKPFYCYHQNPEFSYYSLDVAEGCLFDCVYCYLQAYLNAQSLVLFVDPENLHDEFRRCSGNLWISTGLLSDSLLAERYFPLLPSISAQIPEGSILDLRTKDDHVEVLRQSAICRDTVVVSWSVNPEEIVRHFEYRTPGLQARLEAARKAIALGYRIGWHLDPVFHFSGWRKAYAALFQQLAAFPVERIAFLSVGLFRYMPDLGNAIRRRFPNHRVLSGEFFVGADRKYHYLRAIRRQVYDAFRDWLEPWTGECPVFWSMEPDSSLVPDD